MSGPRVVHVTQPVEAGVARVVLDLLRDQQQAGWCPVLVCPDGWLADQAQAAGLDRLAWRAGRSPGPGVPAETRALRALLDELDPDLVHLHSSKAGLAGRLALRGRRPTVFQPHAWSFAAATGGQAVLARGWERLAARWTDLQLCCSSEEQEQGRQVGVQGRSEVVPNGVDLSRFPAVTGDERAAARAALALPDDVLVAVCVGRLGPQKGQDTALAAWPAVRAALPGARLLLVGEGPARDELERAAGEGVELLGHRDDVASLMAAADLALLPSRWEGLALALLEAMARGLPVVATDVGGARSTLLHGDLPPAGVVVQPDDPSALSAAVVSLGNAGARRDLAAAARQRVVRDHELGRATERVRHACEPLLA